MDSIPCEKVLHCVAEKNRTACFIKSHADGDLKNIALRAGWKGFKGFFTMRMSLDI